MILTKSFLAISVERRKPAQWFFFQFFSGFYHIKVSENILTVPLFSNKNVKYRHIGTSLQASRKHFVIARQPEVLCRIFHALTGHFQAKITVCAAI